MSIRVLRAIFSCAAPRGVFPIVLGWTGKLSFSCRACSFLSRLLSTNSDSAFRPCCCRARALPGGARYLSQFGTKVESSSVQRLASEWGHRRCCAAMSGFATMHEPLQNARPCTLRLLHGPLMPHRVFPGLQGHVVPSRPCRINRDIPHRAHSLVDEQKAKMYHSVNG